MSGDAIVIHRRGQVATITLSRPSESNALGPELAVRLADACAALADDDSRVVVLTGAGKAFATGGEGSEADGHPAVPATPTPAAAVAALRKPTIAWINGDCLDRGLEMALACDVRIAAPTARLGLRAVSQGWLPQDGGTQRLPRLVGRGHALRLLLTGDVIDAQEALRIGLVQAVGDRRTVEELADRIAAAAPIAVAYAKEAVRQGEDLALEQGLRLEADLSILLHGTADRAKGLESFAAGTRPNHEGR